MYEAFTSISDGIVIFFDLLIYMKLTALKRDTPGVRTAMRICCGVILALYLAAVYVWKLPAVLSSFLFMSVPSFVIFLFLSKYKDSRFFVTFCFVDTVSLAMASFARALGIYGGAMGAAAGCLLLLAVFSLIYYKGRPYFPQYRNLLERVQDGWGIIMVSSLLIYLLMVVTASYPVPLVQRIAYVPVYCLLSVTVISFYVVFISSLFQKKNLYDVNLQLTKEKMWHDNAYVDGLTGLRNRMAYMERINALTRSMDKGDSTYAVMLDIDSFKQVNDTLGHHTGDAVLKQAAQKVKETFAVDGYETFRIGGDEFAVLGTGTTEETLVNLLNQLNLSKEKHTCEFSYGFSRILPEENNAVENAFIRADAAMYQQKNRKKHKESLISQQ